VSAAVDVAAVHDVTAFAAQVGPLLAADPVRHTLELALLDRAPRCCGRSTGSRWRRPRPGRCWPAPRGSTGAGRVLLFTDAANRTTNALYARVGHRPVLDFASLDLVPAPNAPP
jgi:hypothetical protein